MGYLQLFLLWMIKKRWDFIEKYPQFGYLLLFSDGSVYVNKTFLEFFESLEFFGSGVK